MISMSARSPGLPAESLRITRSSQTRSASKPSVTATANAHAMTEASTCSTTQAQDREAFVSPGTMEVGWASVQE
jgi:hypothetical protein